MDFWGAKPPLLLPGILYSEIPSVFRLANDDIEDEGLELRPLRARLRLPSIF